MNKIILVVAIAFVWGYTANGFDWPEDRNAAKGMIVTQPHDVQSFLVSKFKETVYTTICSFSRLIRNNNPTEILVKLMSNKIDKNEPIMDKGPEPIAAATYLPAQQTALKGELAAIGNPDYTQAPAGNFPLANGFYKLTEKDKAEHNVSRRQSQKTLASTRKKSHEIHTGRIVNGFLKVDITN